MTNAYPALSYRGDVTSAEEAQPGTILGWDEAHRPYEVIEAVFCPAGQTFENGGTTWQGCPAHGRVTAHTTVFLQYARPETMREHGAEAMLHYRMRGLL